MSRQAFDCVVIGAGIVGVSSAIWLQRAKLAVALIDPEEPGSGASFGNAGCFNGSSIVPMSMPGVIRNVPRWLLDPMGPLAIRKAYIPSLMPWLWRFVRAGRIEEVRRQATALRSLLSPSLTHIKQLAGPAGALSLIEELGHLYVYRDRSSLDGDALAWSIRRDEGVQLDELNQEQLREFDSNLSPEFRHGVFIRENGHTTNPGALVRRLSEHFVNNGGVLLRCAATSFVLSDNRLEAVRTTKEDVYTTSAVLAAGAHSAGLARMLGDVVPLETERGYHLMIADPEVVPRIPTSDADGKYVVTPMQDGLRLAGTVEFGGLKASPDWHRADILLTYARRMLPGLPAEIPSHRLSRWMGHRPSLPDSLPVIGRSRRSRDVVYAFGHGHVGMTGAPLTGRIVADLVSGRDPPIDIVPFRADRFRT